MDDRTVDRIFAGILDNLPPVSSKIVRIFTSSTFTDMSVERNTLMEKVYPRLKDYCRERHGLEFQVVDMRWGVRDEATDDHMTTDLCMKEIENCQRLSMGANFVVFLGQKYGYRPIPTIIDGAELNQMKEALVAMGCDVHLVERWYAQDTNTVPPVYILQPISSILVNFNNKRVPKLQAQDQATWWDTLAKLQKLLRKAAQALHGSGQMSDDAFHNYMMAVTEREVINGVLNVKNTRNHCLAYIRQINNINMANLKSASKFIDVINRNVDTEAQKLLSNLRDERLPAKIEATNIVRFTVEWMGRDGLDAENHKDYLRQFTAHFYKHIIKLVDRAMRKEDLSSQGQIVTEILQHLHACNNAVKIFQGREEELVYITNYLTGPSSQPMVLHGEGGCGKTSLLAKSASMVCKLCPPDSKPIVVLRFLGTTPDSSTVVPMLTSICNQISYNYIIPWTEVPDDLIPLIAYLKRLLNVASKEQPLYILLDSVDQLAGCNEANMLSWLPSRLPNHVKIIVSTVSGTETHKEHRVLQKMLENDKMFVDVKPLGTDLALYVIKTWLASSNRDLNAYQYKLVRNALSRCTLPIFVKLVFADICRWKSYSKPADTTLANTVMDSIMKLFDRIELQHGKTLVFHALAYITASKSGLSETELEDLISMDDKVLDDVYQYHLPPVRRIPPLLWTRIRNDLPNYLSEREADGVSVLNWYHRQFREAALERYFKNMNTVCYFHSSVADYFLGIWGGGTPKPFKYTEIQKHRFGLTDKEGSADRKVPLQPMVFTGSDGRVVRYNLRKFGELPFHLVRSKRFEDLFENVLFSYQWLHSKLSSCPLQAVLADFEDAKEHLTDKDSIRGVVLVADALRLGGAILSQYPNMLAPQMIARLLPLKQIYQNVKSLLEQCDNQGYQHCGLIPAYHSLHTPGGPLKYSLEGHHFAIFGFVLTSDSRYVLSVSNKFIMWDLSTGEVTRDVNPNIRGIMQTLAISPDDKHALTYTNYNEVLLLSLLSGDVHSFKVDDEENENSVQGVTVSDTLFVVWTLKEWTVYTLTGKKTEENEISENKYSILRVLYLNASEYYLMLRRGNDESSGQVLKSFKCGKEVTELFIDGGLVLSSDRNQVYVSQNTEDSKITVAIYEFTEDPKPYWNRVKTVSTEEYKVLSLELTPCETYLIGTFTLNFTIWHLPECKRVQMDLPHGVRNISTKPLQSQSSLVLTEKNQYAIGGVRKNLYVWDVQNGLMLKVLDAHFGRILQLVPLIVDEFNAVISSSIDRSVKVWNVNNIFEQVHAIDRMEMPIDSMSLAKESDTGVTVTRGCLGVWNLTTGRLMAKLADSPVGAIVTHAVITSNAKYIVCVESGNLLVWCLETSSVHQRMTIKNVQQLLLTPDHGGVFVNYQLEEEEQEEGGSVPSSPVNNALVAKKIVCSCKSIPELVDLYSFTYPAFNFKKGALTADGQYLVNSSTDKGRDCLLVHAVHNGQFIHKVYLRMTQSSGFAEIITYPAKGYLVGLIGGEKSYIIDVKNRKLLRTLKKWNGSCTSDGKLGLFAPNRGGLELIELRRGTTARVLQSRMSEGVFNVMAQFNTTNDYVLYYHSGRRTVQAFRVVDGKMIANYRLSAEAGTLATTSDGHCVVVGGVDGSLTVLVIVDPNDPEGLKRLAELPSRKEQGSKLSSMLRRGGGISFKTTAKLVAKASAFKGAGEEDPNTSKACTIS